MSRCLLQISSRSHIYKSRSESKGEGRKINYSTVHKLIGEVDDSGQQIGHNISLLGITRGVPVSYTHLTLPTRRCV